MGRDKVMTWRLEGMEYALRVAKKKGIDGLEDELRRRGITHVPIPLENEDIDAISKEITENCAQSTKLAALVALQDCFHFGKTRLSRFVKAFNGKVQVLNNDGYEGLIYFQQQLKEECNLPIELDTSGWEDFSDAYNAYKREHGNERY